MTTTTRATRRRQERQHQDTAKMLSRSPKYSRFQNVPSRIACFR